MTKTLIAALLLFSVEALGQIGSCPEDPLNRPVERFEVTEAGIFDAILQLGHETGTSMSVMGWGLDLFEKRVTVTALDSTVDRVLTDILRPLPAAWVDQTDNVVTIHPYALLPPLEEFFVGQRYWTVLGYSEGLDVNLRIAQWRKDDLRHRKTPGR